MPALHLLGTGAAFSGPERTTTMLAFNDTGSTLLVDCGGDVINRVLAAGLDVSSITGLIVTHEHPDHVGGFPLFMERIWLSGRRDPIPVYGIEAAISQARRAFEVYATGTWTGLPEIEWHEVEHEEGASVLKNDVWEVTASPVVHPVPIIGVRVTHVPTGRSVAYSCDTEPTDNVVRLAEGADILVHEATGEGKGHTSAAQAAEIAKRAGAKKLLLVHLPPGNPTPAVLEAREIFHLTYAGNDLDVHSF